MGHSDGSGDGGTSGQGTQGCGGNMLAAGATANKGRFVRRNVRAVLNTAASLRAVRSRLKNT